jgi:CRISPR system Cascade subunit CasB
VGTVVDQRIRAIQAGVRANRSVGVAALARLRRGVGKPPGTVNDILEYTLAQEFVHPGAGDAPTTAERAAHISMTLYAVHQQSQGQPMHKRGEGLGRAVRRLIPGDLGTQPHPVLRRFQALGTSDSLDELTHHLRGVVQLLRTKQIELDYALLADQLVRWQRPDGPASVRLMWGRDFYRTQVSHTTPDPDSQ